MKTIFLIDFFLYGNKEEGEILILIKRKKIKIKSLT
jgi:hypothetical protein